MQQLSCAAADLCVAEGHVLTQSVDVLLTGVVQLRLQADVLGLQRLRRGFCGFHRKDSQRKQKLSICAEKKTETQTGFKKHHQRDNSVTTRAQKLLKGCLLRCEIHLTGEVDSLLY